MKEYILPIGLALLSIVTTVAIAVVGFVFKMVFDRIKEVKTDTLQAVKDEETRRETAVRGIYNDVNKKFDDIKTDLREIREDIKQIPTV